MGSAKTPSIFNPSAASIARGLRIVGGHWLSRKAVGLPRAIAVLKVLRDASMSSRVGQAGMRQRSTAAITVSLTLYRDKPQAR